MSDGKFEPSANTENPYFTLSPKAADRGEIIGTNPAFLSVETLKDLGHPTAPMRAIRAHCVECCGGSYAEANKCTATGCTLWPYRMGKNPFHAKAKTRKPATAATVRALNPKTSNAILGGLSDE